jgi:hypothetical protein
VRRVTLAQRSRTLTRRKALRAGHGNVALVGNCQQRCRVNDERERLIDEVRRLRERGNP